MPDNPDAYPRPFSESENHYHPAAPGMTLLDFFAGHAIAGLLADPNVVADAKAASTAYKVALFMLEERQKHIYKCKNSDPTTSVRYRSIRYEAGFLTVA